MSKTETIDDLIFSITEKLERVKDDVFRYKDDDSNQALDMAIEGLRDADRRLEVTADTLEELR